MDRLRMMLPSLSSSSFMPARVTSFALDIESPFSILGFHHLLSISVSVSHVDKTEEVILHPDGRRGRAAPRLHPAESAVRREPGCLRGALPRPENERSKAYLVVPAKAGSPRQQLDRFLSGPLFGRQTRIRHVQRDGR